VSRLLRRLLLRMGLRVRLNLLRVSFLLLPTPSESIPGDRRRSGVRNLLKELVAWSVYLFLYINFPFLFIDTDNEVHTKQA
jgi:hypothetical protein